MLSILGVILAVAAIALTVLRPTKSKDAIRAIAAVGICVSVTIAMMTTGFLLGLTSAAWAAIEFVLPYVHMDAGRAPGKNRK